MLQGFSLPRTPEGRSSLAPAPPWHYVANALAVSFRVNPAAAAAFLPEGLTLASDRAAVYFVDWQAATDDGEEYLDPVRSQYKETIFLLSAAFRGQPVSYCPFIFVDQDISLMRGLAQGWPKQIGSIWLTRAYGLPSKAAPAVGPGGRFGATLAVKDRRYAEARITLRERAAELPSPSFARAVNVRHFPDLCAGRHQRPLVHQLVQLRSRDVQVGDIWRGEADLEIFSAPACELADLCPVSVEAGYRFAFALTVDDLEVLQDLGNDL
jgi:acetoacetate decarboxylase